MNVPRQSFSLFLRDVGDHVSRRSICLLHGERQNDIELARKGEVGRPLGTQPQAV